MITMKMKIMSAMRKKRVMIDEDAAMYIQLLTFEGHYDDDDQGFIWDFS